MASFENNSANTPGPRSLWSAENLARIERLKNDHEIDIESVADKGLRKAIFGDYIFSETPSTSLEHVKQAYRFKDQAARTVPSCPSRALHFFLRNAIFLTGADMDCDQTMFDMFWSTNRVIHAVISQEVLSSAIVSFLCPLDAKRLEPLVCSARRAQQQKRTAFLIQDAIRQEGLAAAVVSFLCPADVTRLDRSNMKRLVHSARRISKASEARRRLRRELLKLGGPYDITTLLEDAATSERVARYVKFSVCLEVVVVAKKLHEFHRLRGDPQARREMLSRALEAEGMGIRTDSTFCRDFVDGSTDVDLDEIVGRMKLAKHLFTLGGHRTWSHYRETANGKFKELYHMEGLSMKEAFEKSVEGCSPVVTKKKTKYRRRYY